MSQSKMVRMEDVGGLLRIMGELAEVKGDLWVRGTHLINQLCSLLHAQVGVFAILEKPKAGDTLAIKGGVEAGFLDETSQRLLRRYVQETYARDPMVDAMKASPQAYTIYRAATVPDEQWYASEFVNEVKFKMKIDDAVYSCCPVEGYKLSVGFGINRMRGDAPFGEREQMLMQLLNTHLGWFHRQVAAEFAHQKPAPAPALRRVLAELLTGASEKQIARRLELSPFTIHDHVKKLYRHYGVSSRPELMALFIKH